MKTEVTVAKEDVQLLVSRTGYVKRSSLRSYKASGDENGLKDDDYPVLEQTVNTLDHLFIFTNKGNVIYRPVHEVLETRWKETGEHLSQSVGLDADEVVIQALCFPDLKQPGQFVFATRNGLIKRTEFAALKPGRTYRSRASVFMKLKAPDDEVLLAAYQPTEDPATQVFCMSHGGYGLRYALSEVPVSGARAAGVKCMDLRDDQLSAVLLVHEDAQVALVTQRGAFKRMKVAEVPLTSRARRGVQILRELKRNPHRIVAGMVVAAGKQLEVMTTTGQVLSVDPAAFPVGDRYSNGSFILDPQTDGIPQRLRTGSQAQKEE